MRQQANKTQNAYSGISHGFTGVSPRIRVHQMEAWIGNSFRTPLNLEAQRLTDLHCPSVYLSRRTRSSKLGSYNAPEPRSGWVKLPVRTLLHPVADLFLRIS